MIMQGFLGLFSVTIHFVQEIATQMSAARTSDTHNMVDFD